MCACVCVYVCVCVCVYLYCRDDDGVGPADVVRRHDPPAGVAMWYCQTTVTAFTPCNRRHDPPAGVAMWYCQVSYLSRGSKWRYHIRFVFFVVGVLGGVIKFLFFKFWF